MNWIKIETGCDMPSEGELVSVKTNGSPAIAEWNGVSWRVVMQIGILSDEVTHWTRNN
jgi:hypothetical protein